jgi:uncharacterized hydrophobic protein (TIGR00271 family)
MTDDADRGRADERTPTGDGGRDSSGNWLNRATILGLILVAGALSALALHEVAERLIALLVGVTMVAAGGAEIFFIVRRHGRRFGSRLVGALGLVVAGLCLVLVPEATLLFAAQVIGVLATAIGVKHLVEDFRPGSSAKLQAEPPESNEGVESRARRFFTDPRTWQLLRSLLLIVGGIVMLVLTEEVIGFALFLLGVGSFVVGVVLIAYGLENRNDPAAAEIDRADISRIVRLWFEDNDIGAPRRDDIAEALYFEPPNKNNKVNSYAAMMLLSTVIATLGVLQDSTAVVIGAMLIAPLMTPILGIGAAIVGGWTLRLVRSLILAFGAAAGGIFVAWLVASWMPGFTDLTVNSQIDSRTSPTLVDLAIALAAGAAGAYATVDKRVSSSITGVAIAVALVPPLSVVGVTLQQQRWEEAWGALLLFLTNAVGIILISALVFALMGFVSLARLRTYWSEARASLATILVSGLLIAVPLGLAGDQILSESSEQGNAEEAVATWLGEDTDLIVSSVTVGEPDVDAILVGPGEYPPIEDLEIALSDSLGYPVVVTLIQVPAQEESYSQEGGKNAVGSGEP